MRIFIKKSVYEELMKSYIARWGVPGDYHYKYDPDTGANGGGFSGNQNGKKNSHLKDATNNATSTTTTTVGIPVAPHNTSTQMTKNYTRLDEQKSQSAIKYLSKIKTDSIQPREFLIKLKQAFGVSNIQNSNYITKKTGNRDITLRLSNHNANGRFLRNNETETSIVIRISGGTFKNSNKKDIVEYVYEPKNLTKEVKDGIIQGLINWINTGIYSDTHADDVKKSIIYQQ